MMSANAVPKYDRVGQRDKITMQGPKGDFLNGLKKKDNSWQWMKVFPPSPEATHVWQYMHNN